MLGLQLSKGLNALDSNVIIHQSRNIVKSKQQENNAYRDNSVIQQDIDILRSIEPRKSVLNFTAEELQLTKDWAERFENDIHKKSLVYRAANGEWRDKETTRAEILSISNYNVDFKKIREDIKNETIVRGVFTNNDTAWNIQISRNGLEDSVKYGFKHKDTTVYNMLYQLPKLVENSILLDSFISERNNSNKAYNTAYIAASCKCSVSSVKRSVCRLEEMGIITHKYRLDGSEGRLGAYHYALKPYDLSKNYFYMNNRKAYSAELSPKLFYVYAVFCKLICNDIARFYQSLNDLSALIRLSRAEVSKVIAVLIDRSMVRKQLKRTRAGDYTDNTYFIITRKQGCIKKAGPRSNRSCSNGLCSRGSSQLKQLYNNTSNGICQSFLRKFLLYKPILFYYGGSP